MRSTWRKRRCVGKRVTVATQAAGSLMPQPWWVPNLHRHWVRIVWCYTLVL